MANLGGGSGNMGGFVVSLVGHTEVTDILKHMGRLGVSVTAVSETLKMTTLSPLGRQVSRTNACCRKKGIAPL
jgi:hypothetical protein